MIWPWIALALLGAWHGLNPAMGWLFAVSRGMQEQRGGAVAAALPPIALGHALAIGLALLVLAIRSVRVASDGGAMGNGGHRRWIRRSQAGETQASALGRYAHRLRRPTFLVVLDGDGTRGGADARPLVRRRLPRALLPRPRRPHPRGPTRIFWRRWCIRARCCWSPERSRWWCITSSACSCSGEHGSISIGCGGSR
jgi:hypothetical protein